MSLFAHLALRFGSHPENLATEALAYLLASSPAARRGFVSSLGSELAAELSTDLVFRSQVGQDDARPDLQGVDGTGTVRLLLEAKFWAGLTDQQPNGYLDMLPDGGVLIVVGPRSRLQLLWRELSARLIKRAEPAQEVSAPGDFGLVKVGRRRLVLTSWERLLTAITVELSAEPAMLADVTQLAGLCERMDAEAFIPVTAEELTSNVYRRVHEFGQMVDDVAALLSQQGVATTKGLRSAASNGRYGKYMRLRGVPALLHVSTHKWTKLAPSPLWITLFGPKWDDKGLDAVRQQLRSYEDQNPGSVHADYQGFPTVRLMVHPGTERHEIVSHVVEQLKFLGEKVSTTGTAADLDTAPPAAEPVQ